MFKVLFVLGGPGSGKGTLCSRLAQELHCVHIPVGELLRASDDEAVAQCINAGRFVPPKLTASIVKQAMESASSQCFLVDGFPRNIENKVECDKALTDVDKAYLYLDCPSDVLLERLVRRSVTSGRKDDNLDVIKQRIALFESEREEFTECLYVVDASLDKEQVFQQALVLAREFFASLMTG